MKIKAGGAIENLTKNDDRKKIEDVKVCYENNTIQMWINQVVLSYLTLDEAIALRNELNEAIKEKAGV